MKLSSYALAAIFVAGALAAPAELVPRLEDRSPVRNTVKAPPFEERVALPPRSEQLEDRSPVRNTVKAPPFEERVAFRRSERLEDRSPIRNTVKAPPFKEPIAFRRSEETENEKRDVLARSRVADQTPKTPKVKSPPLEADPRIGI